jgi:ribonuclease Z
MAEIVFLGTSSMVPTKERNHSAFFLGFGSDGILFDCGEGTQRQLKIAGINPNRINKILLSHWHGDHTLGLPGLLQTLAANKYEKTLEIYGPPGTKKSMGYIFKSFIFLNQINIKVFEIKKTKFFENEAYTIEAYALEHKVPCFGFRFIEKDIVKVNMPRAKELGIPEGPIIGALQSGKSVVFKGKKIRPSEVTYVQKGRVLGYIADTNRCDSCLKIAKNADILISESTFESKLDEKAEGYTHMTAKDAAMVASASGAKKLLLTHFSQRYASVDDLQEEARTYFPNSACAYDFMKVQF